MKNGIPIIERPEQFQLDRNHPLFVGLVFAGLAQFPGSTLYHDSACGSDGVLTGYSGAGDTPADKWQWDPYLRRMILGFDGSDDYVLTSCPALAGAADFTLSFWAKAPAYAAAKAAIGYYTSSYNLVIYPYDTGSQFRTYGIGPAFSSGVALSVAATSQNHFCFTHSLASASLYVNGQYVASGSGTPESLTGPILTLGSAIAGEQFFAGSLGDVLWHNRLLSSATIARLGDPSDPLVSGLIAPPRRRSFAAAAPASPAATVQYRTIRIGEVTEVTVSTSMADVLSYHWYLDGAWVGKTSGPTKSFMLGESEQLRLTAVPTTDPDFDPIAHAPAGWPGRRTLWWVRSIETDVATYRVEQQAAGGAWETLAEIPQNPGQWDFSFVTDRLDDLTEYTWRITPIDAAGNEGDPITVGPENIVRTPDAPKFTIEFDEQTQTVEFTEQ